MKLDSVQLLKPAGREGIINEVKRLKAGGQVNEKIIEKFSAADRVLFEVMMIEALSEGREEDREKLRSNLIRTGFDDYYARRLLRLDIPGYVRASSILRLLSLREEAAAEPGGETLSASAERGHS
jgi:hypothetical protein